MYIGTSLNKNFLAILITGTRTVEALTSDGYSLCVLKEELPYRRDHTMDGDLLCGGNTRGSPAQPVKRKRKYAHDRSLSRKGRSQSCLRFSKGSWSFLPFGLHTQRRHHSSWKLPGFFVITSGIKGEITEKNVSEDQSMNSISKIYFDLDKL